MIRSFISCRHSVHRFRQSFVQHNGVARAHGIKSSTPALIAVNESSLWRKNSSFSSRNFCAASTGAKKIVSPPMVYVAGEEMTRYAMEIILEKWITPHIDTSKWKFYDLSCVSRDSTKDQVLRDVIEAGRELGSIFKEPTVTPTAEQKEKLGLSQAWGSPNGAMRRGWNGITISRDTIMIAGMQLGYKKKVLFERHAVGGEYGAGWGMVGAGKLQTVFTPKDGGDVKIIDERQMDDEHNAVVTYHNPLDNVADLAEHFFQRCLAEGVTPYVVTKKTVFKWQETFWTTMKKVFDEKYKQQFRDAKLLENTGGELAHLISDAATMQIIRWTGGGFGMAAHNYDGDMLTDEISQMHRSPGFITSNLLGKTIDKETGREKLIKEFEASHGTVADMYDDHLAGKETSLNPLGMVEALIGALEHSLYLDLEKQHPNSSPAEITEKLESSDLVEFTRRLRRIMHRAMVEGKGTRDISGPEGLTTEEFVDHVGRVLRKTTPEMKAMLAAQERELRKSKKKWVPVREASVNQNFDIKGMRSFFNDLDTNSDGSIDFDEFCAGMIKIGVFPRKFFSDPSKRPH